MYNHVDYIWWEHISETLKLFYSAYVSYLWRIRRWRRKILFDVQHQEPLVLGNPSISICCTNKWYSACTGYFSGVLFSISRFDVSITCLSSVIYPLPLTGHSHSSWSDLISWNRNRKVRNTPPTSLLVIINKLLVPWFFVHLCLGMGGYLSNHREASLSVPWLSVISAH